MTVLLIGLLSLALVAAGGDGTLRVRTDVAGVSVLIDEQEAGETPATISPVSSGRHRVTLIKPGYQDHSEEIDVKDGATVRQFVVMKPIEVTLPPFPIRYRAIHQHRAGACVGQLTLEANGINYRGDDGQDVFNLPIRDVRSVARSSGAVPFGFGLATDLIVAAKMKAKVIPARIEAPGRSYGFWATDSASDVTDPDKLDDVAIQKTKELFEVLYRLWNTSLKK